jgi:hypothetical protein
MEGFDPKWCPGVQDFVQKGSVGIKVNEGIRHYFRIKKGLC